MKEKAVENFLNGYSCSEAVVKAAADEGIVSKDLVSIATPFSGGMSSGCLCGAIAGAQIILGAKFGRHDASQSRTHVQALSKNLIDEFKKQHKFTCCKVLSAGFEHGSAERKQNCCKFVSLCAEQIENICLKEKV